MIKSAPADFMMRGFLDNMSEAEKVENLSTAYENDKEKQAHFGKGAYQQGHKQTNGDNSKGYGKGGGDGLGGSKKQLTCTCGKRFVPQQPNHTNCSLTSDCKKASKEDDVTRATKLLDRHASGEMLIDKCNANHNKKWGKNKKAGAKKAGAKLLPLHQPTMTLLRL